MPSLGEAPNGGAKPFGSFLAFEKGTRRKGETISGRYRSDGYVRIPVVGASFLAKDFNDNACCLDKPGVHTFFASKLACMFRLEGVGWD